jgi:hypothetical protein
MTNTYRVQYTGTAIAIATITTNNTIKEVHWINLQNQSFTDENIMQISISSSSHLSYSCPSQISNDTIIRSLISQTIPNYVANGPANYNWIEI